MFPSQFHLKSPLGGDSQQKQRRIHTQKANSIQERVSNSIREGELEVGVVSAVIMYTNYCSGQFAPLLLILVASFSVICESFLLPPHDFVQHTTSLIQQTASSALENDAIYTESFRVIDECAAAGEPADNLYDSVRYIDKKALKLYPNDDAKNELWERAHGSWKLQLATGGGKYTNFKPVPIFAYAMIDELCFGNGVGLNQDTIILSLLGPHHFNAKRRQMGIGIDDMYLFSNKVTPPSFIANGMGLGKTPKDYEETKSRMPTFTIIGASDRSLIARGGTGGIAIWTRLDKDIRPAAYGINK